MLKDIAEEKAILGLQQFHHCFANLPNQTAAQALLHLLESLANTNQIAQFLTPNPILHTYNQKRVFLDLSRCPVCREHATTQTWLL